MTLRPRTIAIAALLSLASGNALAWETRVLTLGDQNRFIEDNANVWIYPQKTVTYTDVVILDLNQAYDGDISAISEEDSAPLTDMGSAQDEQALAVPVPEHNAAGQDRGILSAVGGGLNWSVTPTWAVGVWTSDYEDPTMLNFLNLAQSLQTSFGAFAEEYMSDQGLVYPADRSADINDAIFSLTNSHSAFGAKPEDAARKLDLFSAWNLSDGLDLGFRLGWGSTSLFRRDSNGGGPGLAANQGDGTNNNPDQQGEVIFNNQHISFGAGITKAWSQDTHLDLGLNYDLRTFSMIVDENDFQFVDPMHSIDIQGRFRFRFSKNWWLVPALQIHFDKFATDISNNLGGGGPVDDDIPGLTEQTLVDGSRVNLDLGIGSHMRVLEKIDVYAAFGLDYDKVGLLATSDQGSNELSYEQVQLPYFRVGAEAPLWDWFTFRIGFRKSVAWVNQLELYTLNQFQGGDPRSYDGDSADIERSYTLAPSTGAKSHYAYLGGTAKVAGWDFTVQVDPQLLYGNPFTQDPWFNRVTISHKF